MTTARRLLVSVDHPPFSAVLIISLDSKLQYQSHIASLEGQKVFGLCNFGGLVAGISGYSDLAGRLNIFDPSSGNLKRSYFARPPLDRRHRSHYLKEPLVRNLLKMRRQPIWGDIHGIGRLGDYFVIVNTVSDSLSIVRVDGQLSYSVDLFQFCIDAGVIGAEYGRHSMKSNYYHFNSIGFDRAESRFYVMGHNTKSPDRSFVVQGRIEYQLPEPRLIPESIIDGLDTESGSSSGKQCHELLEINENLFYCESVNSSVSFLNKMGESTQFYKNRRIGYVRGLAHHAGVLFVGSSTYREAAVIFPDESLEFTETQTAPAIFCIDMIDRKLVSIIDLHRLCGYRDLEIKNILAL